MNAPKPTHAFFSTGTIGNAVVDGTETKILAVIFGNGNFTTITDEAAKNWTPNGKLSFGQAMCTAMEGYRVHRQGDNRVVQYHADDDVMAVNVGQQSFIEYTPTAHDMVASDWFIMDLALLGRRDPALPG